MQIHIIATFTAVHKDSSLKAKKFRKPAAKISSQVCFIRNMTVICSLLNDIL